VPHDEAAVLALELVAVLPPGREALEAVLPPERWPPLDTPPEAVMPPLALLPPVAVLLPPVRGASRPLSTPASGGVLLVALWPPVAERPPVAWLLADWLEPPALELSPELELPPLLGFPPVGIEALELALALALLPPAPCPPELSWPPEEEPPARLLPPCLAELPLEVLPPVGVPPSVGSPEQAIKKTSRETTKVERIGSSSD
jgi:hypothetical protein